MVELGSNSKREIDDIALTRYPCAGSAANTRRAMASSIVADGRRLFVPHPEFLWIPANVSRTILVATEPDAPEFVDVLLVTSIRLGNGTSRWRAGRTG